MPHRIRLLLLVLLAVASLLIATPARAVTTLFVDDDLTCDDADGVPFYCTIQAAVDDAVSGDTIQIAAGTYIGTGSYVVNIPPGLGVILDGAGEGMTVIDGQNTRGGIVADAVGAMTVKELSVINGSSGQSGGGIQISSNASVDITDVTVQDNLGGSSGGGIYGAVSGGQVMTLTRVSFIGNTSPSNGGGLHASSSGTFEIVDSVFTANTTDGSGGAIYVVGSSLEMNIEGTVFTDNAADNDGGAILFNGNGSGTLEITSSTFHSNETGPNAESGGGAITFGNSPSLFIADSTFTENTTSLAGGGIADLTSQAMTVENSTFADNGADTGGAIFSSGLLYNVTVSGNTATTGGGIVDSGSGTLTIGNSIVYGNTADNTDSADCSGSISSAGYNMIGVAAACNITGLTSENMVGIDPQLSAIDDNGGPTKTMAIDGDSPARDGGDPDQVLGVPCPAKDQRFRYRSDGRCDIGAYEVATLIRYAGASRYETAAMAVADEYGLQEYTPHVFIATGTNFPDALAGAVSAGATGAPLLLVDSGIPALVAQLLSYFVPEVITILGGTGVVSQGVEDALASYAMDTVERIAGSNRYLTAVEISQARFPVDGSADIVYVATGLGFADALAAAPAAVAGHGPVLLVPGTSIPQEVADEIIRLTPDRVVVVGGTAVISDTVLTALDNLQGGDLVERISGANRYATAVAISQDAFPGGAPRVYIATGLNFPDALAGAALAGGRGVVLLVPGSSVPQEVSDEITRLGATTIFILGGTGVVTTAVEDILATLIGAD